MLGLERVILCVGIGIALLPERLDEDVPLPVGVELEEDVPLLRGDDVNHFFLEPFLVLGRKVVDGLLLLGGQTGDERRHAYHDEDDGQ
jgi:hypothetical protein